MEMEGGREEEGKGWGVEGFQSGCERLLFLMDSVMRCCHQLFSLPLLSFISFFSVFLSLTPCILIIVISNIYIFPFVIINILSSLSILHLHSFLRKRTYFSIPTFNCSYSPSPLSPHITLLLHVIKRLHHITLTSPFPHVPSKTYSLLSFALRPERHSGRHVVLRFLNGLAEVMTLRERRGRRGRGRRG